jgi:putative DNA primase/helicase
MNAPHDLATSLGLPEAFQPWGPMQRLKEPSPAEPTPFPFDALGPILGPAARVVHEDVQAPDALAAGSILAAASLAAQCHADVIMPHGQRAPLSLFIPTAAESGERKSSCDAVVQREVEEIRKEQARQYQAELEAAQGDKEAEQPIARSLTIGKGTVEGIESILKRQSHVGVFSAEGGEFLGGHSMREDRRSAGLAWLLKAWSAETLDSLTRGNGLTVLLGRRVAMHVMVQPILLRGLLADPLAQGQGLLARCLIAQPRSLAGTRMFKPVNPNDRQELRDFHGRMRALLRRPPPLFGGGDGYELNPRALRMSTEARTLWIEFYNAIEREQAPGGRLEHARAFASKAAEHAARLAGVVQLITDPDAAEICIEAMDCGMTLAEFYTSEHVRLTGAGAEERHYGVISGLLEWLAGRGPLVPHRDVLQRAPRPIRELKAEGIARLVGELAERNYIRRAGDSWEVNPDA